MHKIAPGWVSKVRQARESVGLSQQALAKTIGISRQALSALEAGRSVPGTDVAIELARALNWSVERLFAPRRDVTKVIAVGANDASFEPAQRVILSRSARGWTARPLEGRSAEGMQPADGVVLGPSKGQRTKGKLEVELLRDAAIAQERLVVMGCAPALALLASRLVGARHPIQLAWVHGTSAAALAGLERGEVHLAGIHLRDAKSGRFNVPEVQRRFARRKMLVVNFAAWEQGLVVKRGNPLHLKSAHDLLRPKLRLVGREAGAGATKLLEQLLPKAPSIHPAMIAHGHLEVARAVAQNQADVGVAISGAALAWGLDFVPLAAERFDLVFSQDLAADPRVERLIDELASHSFRRELDSLGGYETQQSGDVTEI